MYIFKNIRMYVCMYIYIFAVHRIFVSITFTSWCHHESTVEITWKK